MELRFLLAERREAAPFFRQPATFRTFGRSKVQESYAARS